MTPNKKLARIAGFWYLIMAFTAPIGVIYVPSKIIVAGNAAATANNILENEMLFRIGIISNFICQIAFIFLVLALYCLLKGVNQQHALLMVALVLVAVPIEFINLLNPLAALLLSNGANFLTVFNLNQLQALALVFINLQTSGTMIAQIFWGLWLFPFGLLVIKSGFFPKILGVLLILACVGYLIHCFTFFLFPAYADTVSSYASIFEGVGEMAMVFWLLIFGAKEKTA